MARAKQNKLYRTFVRGLITEAGFLTYPEDASYDELNTVLFRKGNRTRRLGMSYSGEEFDPGLGLSDRNVVRTEFVWKAVNNLTDTNFLVQQTGRYVHFFELGSLPITANRLPFSIDLASYLRPGVSVDEIGTQLSFFAAGKGLLFIVNEKIEPLSVKYVPQIDNISVTTIKILIRDFEGLDDGLQNDEEPSVLSAEHHYNLQNQGWVTGNQSSSTFSPVTLNGYLYEPGVFSYNANTYGSVIAYQNSTADSPIFKFQSVLGRYPGNNKQWWVARAEADDEEKGVKAGDFLPDVLNKLFSGNNKAPNGHYILDAFRKDRGAASGISGLPIEDINVRPNAVTFFSGRAWYGASSTVYYSQILDNNNSTKAGLCYQQADPTAEDISELIATDGGVVPIPEADKIIRMMPLANGVVVFAMNGVWFISGGDQAFSATNISVSKISPIGTRSPLSIIETDGQIYWWSEIGIQALAQESGQFGPIPGKFGNTNISEQTIQTFFNDVNELSKTYVKAIYDTRNNIIQWLYSDDPSLGNYAYNCMLNFDLTLQAFYPWKLGELDNGPVVTGAFLDVGFSPSISEAAVTAEGSTVTAGGASVTVGEFETDIRPSNIYYTIDVPLQGWSLARTKDITFADWVLYDGVGAAYDSFIETGFEIHDDAMRKKQIVYLFAHLAMTNPETNPSSCKMITKWDWSNSSSSNRWSTEVEVYRPRNRPTPTTADNAQGFDVITTKNKVRGNGKAVQFRFGTNEIGKTFDLLGWSVAYVGNTEP